MTLTPGSRLGPYEIVSALGAGGMGEVYKARDLRLDRTVAIKILQTPISDDPSFRERFEREARAISRLDHPRICTLYDVGEQGGTSFLVMQHLEGETLEAKLKKGELPVDLALQVATQVVEALDAAHRAGIVHRDLKPGNVMLTKNGAVLLDFGLAKAAGSGAGSGVSMLQTVAPNLTAQGTILGTLQYMAPEQLEGKEADTRADVFAVGAIIYEMLTGRRAFERSSQAALISAILKDQPPPVSSYQVAASPLIDRIVDRCLAKGPDDRFQSTRDLLTALRWAEEFAHESTSLVSEYARSSATDARLWKMATAIAAAAAVLLVWPAVLQFRSTPSEPGVTRLDVVTPDTSDPLSFALSPDGRRLVFVSTTSGEPRLWVRAFDQSAERPLSGTEGAAQPFWSPDGTAVGFFADGRLKRAELDSGSVRVLADAPVSRGGTWSREGVIVYSPMINSGLMRVPANGGTPAPVTTLIPGEVTHRWPHFLPDGRRFLYLSALGQADLRGAFLGSLDGGTPRRVLNSDSSVGYAAGWLTQVSQGTLVAYRFDPTSGSVSGSPVTLAQNVSSDGGGATGFGGFSISSTVLAHRSAATSRRQLLLVDRTGNRLGAIGPPDDSAPATPTLSPDGRRLALFRNVAGNPDIWVMELDRAVQSRFTSDPAIDNSPLWSPDASRLVFTSNRTGHWSLFEKRTDGSDERRLLVNDQEQSPLDWSRDGRFLLYGVQDPKTRSDLWVLPMTGGGKPFPVVQTSFDEMHGRFSPDGRWLAYVTNETGRYEVYVRPFPGPGERVQVSTGGGIFPLWPQNGSELFYLALDNHVIAVPFQAASGGPARLGAAATLFHYPRLAVAGNNGIGSFLARTPYAVMPDGRFLFYVTAEEATPPIRVVLNWPAALKN